MKLKGKTEYRTSEGITLDPRELSVRATEIDVDLTKSMQENPPPLKRSFKMRFKNFWSCFGSCWMKTEMDISDVPKNAAMETVA